MAYFLYNLFLVLVSPLAVPYIFFRALAKGMPGNRFRERLGLLPHSFDQTSAASIWLHAVSVGEVLSCVPLVKQLREAVPAAPLFVSTTTAAGQQMAEERLSALTDGIFFVPLDLPFSVGRVLNTIKPRLVIVSETEIWPNLFRLSKRFGAGLLLVNGRISDRALPRYLRFERFFSKVLGYPDLVLAQSEQDATRFIAAGAPARKVQVGGNIKYDFEPASDELPAALAEFFEQVQPSPVIVAGSTREDEEQPLVDAFREVREQRSEALMVVAPRHPRRFEEAASVLEQSKLPFARRSELGRDGQSFSPPPALLLLDSLGELSSLYGRADVVFVGGSLNGWGGHNVLEPAHYARPVIVGPHMQNFQAITAELVEQQAIRQVTGANELAAAMNAILDNPKEAEELGLRARQAAESRAGATQRAVEEAVRLHNESIPATPRGALRSCLLWLPSLLWGAASRLRLAAYRRNYLRKRRLRAFTVCVGNITAGGTGKTPMVQWLLDGLHSRGRSLGVILRGYGRLEPEAATIIPPGTTAMPRKTGDEAQVILRHLQRTEIPAPVGIGADRYRVGRRLETSDPPEIIVLDDGFQHLALERDIDLVLIDVTNPFGGDAMIPLGRLREPLSGLARASVFVLTRTARGGDYVSIKQRLKQWNPRAAVFISYLETDAAVYATSGETAPLDALRNRRAVAFCGLGNPDPFWRSLEDLGIKLAERIRFQDHHRYSKEDVERIAAAAQQHQAHILLTTEKDLVNLSHAVDPEELAKQSLDACAAQFFGAVPLVWLRPRVVVDQGDELLDWLEGQIHDYPASDEQPTRLPEEEESPLVSSSSQVDTPATDAPNTASSDNDSSHTEQASREPAAQ